MKTCTTWYEVPNEMVVELQDILLDAFLLTDSLILELSYNKLIPGIKHQPLVTREKNKIRKENVQCTCRLCAVYCTKRKRQRCVPVILGTSDISIMTVL